VGVAVCQIDIDWSAVVMRELDKFVTLI